MFRYLYHYSDDMFCFKNLEMTTFLDDLIAESFYTFEIYLDIMFSISSKMTYVSVPMYDENIFQNKHCYM